jgi:hypothetical protein
VVFRQALSVAYRPFFPLALYASLLYHGWVLMHLSLKVWRTIERLGDREVSVTEEHQVFYMCGVCFRTSSQAEVCHDRPMLRCDTGCWGDECRKPLMTASGRIQTRAPRWWLKHRPEFNHIH